jgi:hypothetical protein
MLDENVPQNTTHNENPNARQTVNDDIAALRATIIGLITARSQRQEHCADLSTSAPITSAEQNVGHEENAPAARAVRAAITVVHLRIIGLIPAWSRAKERYADLRSRASTPEAQRLIFRISEDIEGLERKLGSRVRKRRVKSGVKFVDAVERFVGDLLRVKMVTPGPARIFRAIGKSSFERDAVKYDTFTNVLEGLKALELVGHLKGQTRYRKTAFGPGEVVSIPLAGRSARFWAKGKLLRLAEQHGITTSNVGEHFAPEPPRNPLVLRDYASGRGRYRERGPIIKYKRTPETERLEGDIRKLNEFLAHFELTGGEHNGYIRVFNNLSWEKGGRLHGVGKGRYQQMPEAERIKMRINGERVSEIDIKASFLTIYHAMIGEPLNGSGDPYVRAGIEDRLIAKLWTVASFGNSKAATRWPPDMAKEYKKEFHKELGKVAKAREVARKMLKALPALKRLEDHSDIWADLQFLEAEAVIGTMLILMREHGVPTLSMHDGIIVPRSQADLAKTILSKEFHRVVGVTPTLTVDTEEPDAASGL